MLPDSVKDWYVDLVDPATRFMAKHRLHPNILTATGFFISISAAVSIFLGSLFYGGILILVGGTFDIFDGRVARSTGLASAFGSFFDSTLDRISEIVIYLSLLYYFVNHGDKWTSFIILVVTGGALMVSYTRARAESLGFSCLVGFFQRQERVVFLGFGAILTLMVGHVSLIIALYVVAVLSTFTALQRIFHVYSSSRNDSGKG